MKKVAEEIPAYTYGTSAVETSPVLFGELNALKVSVGFTAEDERYHPYGWRGTRRTDEADRRPLARRHYCKHSKPRKTFAYSGRCSEP